MDTADATLDEVKQTCIETWEFLVEVVQPARTPELLKPYKGLIDRWWQLERHRAQQYRELREANETCFVIPFVAKHVFVAQLPADWVFTNKLCVIKNERAEDHLVLLSSVFEAWVRKYGGTMGKTSNTLSLAEGVQTFPLIEGRLDCAEQLVRAWEEAFVNAEQEVGEPFTKIWNAFHDPTNDSAAITQLRISRAEIDVAVVNALELLDVDVSWQFTKRTEGIRLTQPEPQRSGLLAEVLRVNRERHSDEVEQGLHRETRRPRPRRKKAKTVSSNQNRLF